MRKFSKVLAMLLAILTVVTMLPLTALAEPWIGVDGSTANGTEESSSTLTVTVNADRLTEILKSNGVSSSLLDELKEGISVDKDALFNIFSMEEIFEIVPQEKLLEAVKIEELLKQIEITDYIEVSELLENSDVDVKALLDLLPEGSKIEDYVDVSKLVKYVDPADAIGYVVMSELIGFVNIQLFVEKAGSNLDEIVVFSELFANDLVVLNDGAVSLEQILEAGLLTTAILNQMVDEGVIKADQVAKLFDDDLVDPLSYFDKALLEEKVYPFVDPTDFVEYITSADLRDFTEYDIIADSFGTTDVVTELVKGFINYDEIKKDVDYNTVISFIDPVALHDYVNLPLVEHLVDLDKVKEHIDLDKVKEYIDPDRFTEDDLNTDLLVLGDDYTVNAETGSASLTDAGLAKIKADPETYLTAAAWDAVNEDPTSYLTQAGKDLVKNDPINFVTPEGKNIVDTNPMNFLTADGKVEVEKDMLNFLTDDGITAFHTDPTSYLTDIGLQEVQKNPYRFLNEAGKKAFEEDPFAVLTEEGHEAIKHDPMKYLTQACKDDMARNPAKYLTDSGMQKIEDLVLDRVSVTKIIEKYIDVDGFTTAVLDCANLDKISKIPGFSGCVDYGKAITIVGVDNIVNNENIDIDYSKLDLSKLKTVTNIDKYVVKENLKLIPIDDMIAVLGGEDNLLDCVDMEAAMADNDLLNKVFTALKADTEVTLSEVVYVNKYLSVVDYMEVLNLLGYDSPLDLLGNDAMQDILSKVDLRPYLKDLITTVVDSALGTIDLITIDGNTVASEDPISATLVLDTDALIKAVVKILPTLQDIANLEDGKLISTEIGITYLPETENATAKTKKIAIELVLEGNIDRLKNVAGELDALLRKYIDFTIREDGSIYLGIMPPTLTVPAELTEIYRDILNDEEISDEVKQKLLDFTNVNGVLGFADTLTLDDVVSIMGAIDVEKLYDAFLSFSYIERAIAKIESATGYNVPDLTLEEIKELMVGAPSIDRICAKIQQKTGYNVKSILEKAADKFDALTDNARVQQMLDFVSQKIGYNLSDISVAEILDRAADAPIFEVVADKVSEKIGKDIMSILEHNTVQEIYDQALQAASSRTGIYKKLQNYVKVLQSYLPAAVMNYRIANSYIPGTSTFREDGKITVNVKDILQKVVNKLTSRFDQLPEDKIDLIMSYIPSKDVTVYMDLALKVTDLYQITFKNRDGSKTYTSVFMPAGTDLTIYKESLELVGYQFTGWADANGNPVDFMPKSDIVVYADLSSVEVTLLDTEGALYTKLYVGAGEVLNAETLKAIEQTLLSRVPTNLVKKYSIEWLDADGNVVELYTAQMSADATYRARLVEQDNIIISGDVTEVETGFDSAKNQYYVRIEDHFETIEHFEIALDRAGIMNHIITLPDGHAAFAIYATMSDGSEFQFVTLTTNKIQKLLDATEEGANIHIPYYRNREGLSNPLYTGAFGNGIEVYSFQFVTDAGEVIDLGNFEPGDVVIKVPLLGKEYLDETKYTDRRTAVYFINEIKRDKQEIIAVKDGFISFYAPHFSDFAVGNEYAINASFYLTGTNEDMSGNCTLELNDFYPEGSTVTLNPVFDTTKYELAYITVNGRQISGTTFTMPDSPVTLTVHLRELKPADTQVFFLVNGNIVHIANYSEIGNDATLYFTQLYNQILEDAAIKAPAGYSKQDAVWVYDASKLGVENTYVALKWAPITYSVTFTSDETGKSFTYEYTIENYHLLTPPAVPEVEGKSGAWAAYDLTSLFSKTTTSMTVKAVYTSKLYSVVIVDSKNGTTIKQAQAGAMVNLGKLKNATYSAFTASGVEVKIGATGILSKMPAETVYVTVNYELVTMTYLINNIGHQGIQGEIVPIDIVLEPGQRLTSMSDLCTYIGSSTDAEGRTVLHYVVKLEGFVNVLYKIEGKASTLFRILNGNIYEGAEDPLNVRKNVKFSHWSDAIGNFSFAVYEVEQTESLLWLWILLTVLILVLVIILVYLLYINGKIGVNALTRAVAWIVGMFFALCLAIARLGMKIATIFGKKDSVEEYGFVETAKSPAAKSSGAQKPASTKSGDSRGGKKKTKGKGGKKKNHKKRHRLRRG